MLADATFQSNLSLAAKFVGDNNLDPNFVPSLPPVIFFMDNTDQLLTSDLIVGSFVILPTAPSVASKNMIVGSPGPEFEMSIFRVSEVLQSSIELRRVSCFASNPVLAEQHALESFGPMGKPLFYVFPVAANAGDNPPPEIKWFVAKLLFLARLRDAHAPQPQQLPPQALPPLPPAGVAPELVQQFGLQQAAHLSASRETTANVLAFARFNSFRLACPPGTFFASLNELMVGLPPGLAPDAGHFKTDRTTARLSATFYMAAQGASELKVSITPAKLSAFVLLDFSGGFSFQDLATPDDKPITIHNISSLMNRVLGYVASIYGSPLAVAISVATTALVTMRSLDCRDLTGIDILEFLERRIHTLPGDSLFSAPSEMPLDDRLGMYFSINRHQNDVARMLDRATRRAAQPPAIPARPPKRQETPSASASPSKASKRGSAASPASSGPSPMSAWYSELFAAHPDLENKPLPCFHWLAGKSPCKDHSTCQKQNGQKLHALSGPAVGAKDAILAWLLKDPLKRFL